LFSVEKCGTYAIDGHATTSYYFMAADALREDAALCKKMFRYILQASFGRQPQATYDSVLARNALEDLVNEQERVAANQHVVR
jgi:hypothetical protein